MRDHFASPTPAVGEKRHRTAAARAGLLAVALAASPVRAEPSQDGAVTLVPLTEVPPAVIAEASCDGAGDNFVSRQDFGGGVLFRVHCPSNNQNRVDSIVRADNSGGREAALVVFPETPSFVGAPSTELANTRVFPNTRTIGEILVDTEHAVGKPCRFESLFRFEKQAPRLVFHRVSMECEQSPAMGWRTMLDVRTPAEKQDDWW